MFQIYLKVSNEYGQYDILQEHEGYFDSEDAAGNRVYELNETGRGEPDYYFCM